MYTSIHTRDAHSVFWRSSRYLVEQRTQFETVETQVRTFQAWCGGTIQTCRKKVQHQQETGGKVSGSFDGQEKPVDAGWQLAGCLVIFPKKFWEWERDQDRHQTK